MGGAGGDWTGLGVSWGGTARVWHRITFAWEGRWDRSEEDMALYDIVDASLPYPIPDPQSMLPQLGISGGHRTTIPKIQNKLR